MADENEIYQKKNGFILYKNYIKSVSKMTNEQAGELFKIILHYANTGELLESDDPRVDTALDFIGERLEFDIQKYLDTCEKRQAAGSKGGSSGKKEQVEEVADEKAAKANSKTGKQTEANAKKNKQTEANTGKTPDTDTVTDTKTVTETEIDTEKEVSTDYYYSSSHNACGETLPDTTDGFTRYGREQHLTTASELQKMHALADELMHSYRGKKATPDDCEKVFGYVHTIGITNTGEHYGIYSEQKADLLRHAFEQASLRSDISWQYISRIYSNYDKHRVTNADEAIQYEMAWNRGEISA